MAKTTIDLNFKDLYADIAEHPNDIVGAWIKILCKIWQGRDSGKLERSLSQIARIIGEGEKETDRILAYIAAENIATVARIGEGGTRILVINRRLNRIDQGPIAEDLFEMRPMKNTGTAIMKSPGFTMTLWVRCPRM